MIGIARLIERQGGRTNKAGRRMTSMHRFKPGRSTRMRSRLLLSGLLVPAFALGSAPSAPAEPRTQGAATFTYTLPGDNTFPEGIAVSANERRYFVSSATDGTIFRGRVHGRAARTFLPGGADGRTSALGLKMDRGRLFVAGGATGSVWVYDLATRELIRRFDTGGGGFINDLAIAPNGDAYVTDSQRPFLYRIDLADVRAGTGDAVMLAPFATYPDFQDGFSANGIVAASPRTLVYANADRLYRVDLPSRAIETVDLRGVAVAHGDGLVLRGRTLFVVRNEDGVISKVRLARDARSGRVVGEIRDPAFRFPTTAAVAGRRLLVVNSQLDRLGTPTPPELPFTVSSIRRP